MANYLTTDTDLTAVADAIRAKGGTSGLLAFPAGFVSAVEAIETGGGGEQSGTVIGTGTSFLTIPVNGTVHMIMVYTDDTSDFVNYHSAYCAAVDGVGMWGIAYGSTGTMNRSGFIPSGSYGTNNYARFNSGAVNVGCRNSGSGNQVWTSGKVYKYIAV